jgi:hypothetical protein
MGVLIVVSECHVKVIACKGMCNTYLCTCVAAEYKASIACNCSFSLSLHLFLSFLLLLFSLVSHV